MLATKLKLSFHHEPGTLSMTTALLSKFSAFFFCYSYNFLARVKMNWKTWPPLLWPQRNQCQIVLAHKKFKWPNCNFSFRKTSIRSLFNFYCQRKSRIYFNSFQPTKKKKVLIIQHWNSRSTKTKVLFPLTMLNIFYYTNFCVTTIWFGYFQIKKTVSFRVESNNLFRKTKINGLRHPELMNLLIFIRIYNCSGVCLCVIHSYEHFVQVSVSCCGETEEKENVKTVMSVQWDNALSRTDLKFKNGEIRNTNEWFVSTLLIRLLRGVFTTKLFFLSGAARHRHTQE